MFHSMGHGRRVVWGFLLVLATLAGRVYGQRMEVQAISGQPFGVAAVSFPLGQAEGGENSQLVIEEKNGRVLYPVYAPGRLARLLGNLVDIQPAAGVRTVFFLFQGNEPLQLTIHAAAPLTVDLQPQSAPPRIQDRLMLRWWREYYASSNELARSGAYSPVVQTYLTGMLGKRLGLRPPLLARVTQQETSQLTNTLGLLMGTEQTQIEMIRQTMAGATNLQSASMPVPTEIAWPVLDISVPDNVAVETIARHVPEECYYVRFGNFENYIWLEGLLSTQGGETNQLVTARGQDVQRSERIRRQLAMPFTVLTKVVGPKLIDDMALIGRDMYLQDGAASGVLLQAHNSAALEASLKQQRFAAMAAEKQWGAKIETVSIAGNEVSFLSTPDNQLRSFYAIDGDYHLVTSSRKIVERFFAAGRGDRALADSKEFQHARTKMPLERQDTVFAFLSTPFLQGLMSPQYQIELRRRLQAVTDMQLFQLARMAAKAERIPAETIDELVAAGLLPSGFGQRADGSKFVEQETRVLDSLRGARGSFTPIPDIELTHATEAEVAEFGAQSERTASGWQHLDPVMVGIKRSARPGKLERLSIEANVSPLAEDKFGWLLSMVGPPVTHRFVPGPDDIIAIQAYVTGGDIAAQIPHHLLYVGVQNTAPSGEFNLGGPLKLLSTLQNTPGYIAAWPKPGYLDWLPLGADQQSRDGFSQLPLGVWRWQGNEFSLFSFDRGILESSIPRLKIEETDTPAQIRVHVGDLSQSKLRDWVNSMYYQRAWQGSVANVRLFDTLTQQMHVAPESAPDVTQRLLDSQLVCPLGGKYEFVTTNRGNGQWRSTAWDAGDGAIPSKYSAPLLHWFRGLELSVIKSEGQVSMHADIDMTQSNNSSLLPLLDLFPNSKD